MSHYVASWERSSIKAADKGIFLSAKQYLIYLSHIFLIAYFDAMPVKPYNICKDRKKIS